MDDPVEAMRVRSLTPLGTGLLFCVGAFVAVCVGIGWLLGSAVRLWELANTPIWTLNQWRRMRRRTRGRLGGTPITDSGLILAITPIAPSSPAADLQADAQISTIIARVASPLPPVPAKPSYLVQPMSTHQARLLEARSAAEPAWTVETMAAYITSLVLNRAASVKAGQTFEASVRVRVPKAIWSDPTFLPVLQKLGVRAKHVDPHAALIDAQGDVVMVEAGMAR